MDAFQHLPCSRKEFKLSSLVCIQLQSVSSLPEPRFYNHFPLSLTVHGSYRCQTTVLNTSSRFRFPHLRMLTNMDPDKKYDHYETGKASAHIQIHDEWNKDSHGARHPSRRRKPNVTALVITAIALALLLAAVIVISTTRLHNSTNNAPTGNTTTSAPPGPPPSPASAEPPEGDEGLSWCQAQDDGKCTLGVHQNLDSGQIRAQVFDHTCQSIPNPLEYASTCHISSEMYEYGH